MQQDDNMRKITTCLIISFLLGPLVPIASASADATASNEACAGAPNAADLDTIACASWLMDALRSGASCHQDDRVALAACIGDQGHLALDLCTTGDAAAIACGNAVTALFSQIGAGWPRLDPGAEAVWNNIWTTALSGGIMVDDNWNRYVESLPESGPILPDPQVTDGPQSLAAPGAFYIQMPVTDLETRMLNTMHTSYDPSQLGFGAVAIPLADEGEVAQDVTIDIPGGLGIFSEERPPGAAKWTNAALCGVGVGAMIGAVFVGNPAIFLGGAAVAATACPTWMEQMGDKGHLACSGVVTVTWGSQGSEGSRYTSEWIAGVIPGLSSGAGHVGAQKQGFPWLVNMPGWAAGMTACREAKQAAIDEARAAAASYHETNGAGTAFIDFELEIPEQDPQVSTQLGHALADETEEAVAWIRDVAGSLVVVWKCTNAMCGTTIGLRIASCGIGALAPAGGGAEYTFTGSPGCATIEGHVGGAVIPPVGVPIVLGGHFTAGGA